MYSSISTLVVILTTLSTQLVSAQPNPSKSSAEVLATARATSSSTLSKRGDELFAGAGSLAAQRLRAGNAFDPKTNPNGFVNLGTAENYLAVPDVAGFVNRNFSLEPKDFTYDEGSAGSARLRNAFAKFLNLRLHPRKQVNPGHLIVANGVTGILNTLGLTLGDPGDGFLLGRPIYSGFQGDFGTVGKIQPIFVDFDDDVDQFSPAAVANYETALIEAEKKGVRIRALVLCNPHNPLGRSYPNETIIDLLKLVNKYKIHLLSDEIYALSIYDNKASAPNPVIFQSVLTIDIEKYVDPKYVQFIYGLSKDTAASGLRVGILYTRNNELLQAVNALSGFQWTGGPSQRAGLRILENEKWLDGFFNRSSTRLASSYELATKILDSEGIQYLKGSNYGFFLWVDLRPYLRPVNTSIEARWQAEASLASRFAANNVSINAGRGFASPEPGFFRVIFSQEEVTFREGWKRVFEVLKSQKK